MLRGWSLFQVRLTLTRFRLALGAIAILGGTYAAIDLKTSYTRRERLSEIRCWISLLSWGGEAPMFRLNPSIQLNSRIRPQTLGFDRFVTPMDFATFFIVHIHDFS
jgi:hypothetical protein